jgi:hypothetical protein
MKEKSAFGLCLPRQYYYITDFAFARCKPVGMAQAPLPAFLWGKDMAGHRFFHV